MKIILRDDYRRFMKLVNEFAELLEVENTVTNEPVTNLSFNDIQETDFIIFDVDDENPGFWREVINLKEINPGIKSILFTSVKNRQYRRYFLSRGIDYCVFKETESNLLHSILKQTHLRKTRHN